MPWDWAVWAQGPWGMLAMLGGDTGRATVGMMIQMLFFCSPQAERSRPRMQL